ATSAYYGDQFDGLPREAPMVSVIDTDAERTLTKTALTLGNRLSRECILPRSAAVRASTGALFVACLGIDSIVELDTRGLDPARLEIHRWEVPEGPIGVTIDDRAGRAVVWSQFARRVSIIDLDAKGSFRTIAVGAPNLEDSVMARGRSLFHRTGDG